MKDAVDGLVAEGRSCLSAGQWEAAGNAFRAALAQAESADAYFGLSESLWWLGNFKEAVDYRQRAYAQYRRLSDPEHAALLAIRLCIDYRASLGNATASDGWLARAERLVDEFELDSMRGWLPLLKAGPSADPAAGEARAREALGCAREAQDLDLELCAMSEVGAMLIKQGKVEEGVAWLDEAMAGSLGGEGGDPDTVVFTSCNMILSCAMCAEFERVVQWVQAADRFMQRYGCLFLRSVCRATYGRVLVATGDWTRAEEEVKAALESSHGSPLYVLALAALAELRLAQGRVEEAGHLLTGFEDLGPTAPVLAAVQLARGEPALAGTTIRRLLPAVGENRLEHAILTELLGQAEILLGQQASAAERGRGLAELGAALDCVTIRARGERLCGRALARQGDAAAARDHLEAALSAFIRLEMPLEAARTRLALAEALRALEPKVAEAEACAAAATFEKLGAGRDADQATALLRELGVKAARSGPRGHAGKLTKREHEVLALLGEGLSNPEIAGRLFISRKTVEHHVAKILAKLGLRSRAQAAAEAVRLPGTNPPPNR